MVFICNAGLQEHALLNISILFSNNCFSVQRCFALHGDTAPPPGCHNATYFSDSLGHQHGVHAFVLAQH